ncbi:retrovirus-related Pol polyprotein from transposon 17.6 [Caerostris darwini]|uniref:Retrovirus-related Pol polyprotein from transposon 17.6 n=1 Tax=Caerostris darwini TaxID=1538125 RepID=A0AAV4TAF3_9ARAC|nr:retrovirus-related Pol polyprotein from transposon 17.6 [Caerostris darwini]
MAVQWAGPGIIESQLSETNYIVKMTNKNESSQIYHKNLSKLYPKRPEKVNLIIREMEEIFGNGPKDVEIKYPSSDPNVFNFEEIVSESDLENQ